MTVREKHLLGNPPGHHLWCAGAWILGDIPEVMSRFSVLGRGVGSYGLCKNCIDQMLTGTELLDKAKEVGDVPKTELAKACGYVITKKDGSEQVKFTQFYEALLEAKGISLGGSAGVGKGGRKLSYKAKVQGNGNLLVGMAYTAMINLKPGDEFTIKLSEKKGVTLIPVESDDEE